MVATSSATLTPYLRNWLRLMMVPFSIRYNQSVDVQHPAASPFGQANPVAEPRRRALLPAVTGAGEVGGLGPDRAVLGQGQMPAPALLVAAGIAERFVHGAAVALPPAVHLGDEARRDAAEGAIDHPLAQHRAVEVAAQVEARLEARVIGRALRGKAGMARQGKGQQGHRAEGQKDCDHRDTSCTGGSGRGR